MTPKKYFINTFRQEMLLFIGCSKEEFQKYCSENFGDHDSDESFGLCYRQKLQKDDVIIIWVYDEKRTDIIAHESLHAANLILDFIGHEPSHTNDEVQCYLMQEIYRACTGTENPIT